jgi:hypothetical protein
VANDFSVAHGRLARLIWALRSTADDLCAELGITAALTSSRSGGAATHSSTPTARSHAETAWQCRHHLAADRSDLAKTLAGLGDDHVMLIATILADHR